MSKQPVINIKVARKLLKIVNAGLTFGLGEPILGQMCVEAAVCFALGQEHGDQPECVSSAVRSLKSVSMTLCGHRIRLAQRDCVGWRWLS